MHEDAHAEGMTERFLELLGDPAHWGFEFATDVAFSLVAYPFIRMVVKVLVARHDRKAHPALTESNTTAEEAMA